MCREDIIRTNTHSLRPVTLHLHFWRKLPVPMAAASETTNQPRSGRKKAGNNDKLWLKHLAEISLRCQNCHLHAQIRHSWGLFTVADRLSRRRHTVCPAVHLRSLMRVIRQPDGLGKGTTAMLHLACVREHGRILFVHSSLPDGGELSLELCSQRTRTVKRKEKGFTGGANELAGLYESGWERWEKQKEASSYFPLGPSFCEQAKALQTSSESSRYACHYEHTCSARQAMLHLACVREHGRTLFVHSSLPDGGELSLELCSQRTRTVKRKRKRLDRTFSAL